MSQLPVPPSPGRRRRTRRRRRVGRAPPRRPRARRSRRRASTGAITGGQQAADQALAALDITGYASRRSTVLPVSRRGATRLSPYIRHGLLPLRRVWDAVADAPARDRGRYRDELMWQEYARHLYARVGRDLGAPLRKEQPRATSWDGEPWPHRMRCHVQATVGELHDDGWFVRTRPGCGSPRSGPSAPAPTGVPSEASSSRTCWTARACEPARLAVDGRDGQRQGLRLQPVAGREARPAVVPRLRAAHGLPDPGSPAPTPDRQYAGPDLRTVATDGGPAQVDGDGGDIVWLTAESLGRDDPALAADPSHPAVFVFDEPLLKTLRLSGKRLVFLAETLGELAAHRELDVRRGRVTDELAGLALAATWAPVPGWASRARRAARPSRCTRGRGCPAGGRVRTLLLQLA